MPEEWFFLAAVQNTRVVLTSEECESVEPAREEWSRHAGYARSARLGMPSMPAGGGLRLEAGGRNASDSFGGGSGMPALLLCPASRASAHAGRDTRAPPGPAPPQEFPPTACRAHEHAANRLPGVPQFLLLVYKWEVWLYWCESDLEEMENINIQPQYCRGLDERWGRSTRVAAGLPAASASACIWGWCVLIFWR